MTRHKNDNQTILALLGYSTEKVWPDDTICKDDLTMWVTNLTKIIEGDIGRENWSKYLTKSYAHYGNPGGLKKNPLAVSCALQSAWDDGIKSKSLLDLVEGIIEFVKKQQAT